MPSLIVLVTYKFSTTPAFLIKSLSVRVFISRWICEWKLISLWDFTVGCLLLTCRLPLSRCVGRRVSGLSIGAREGSGVVCMLLNVYLCEGNFEVKKRGRTFYRKPQTFLRVSVASPPHPPSVSTSPHLFLVSVKQLTDLNFLSYRL